jgi:hypothetical protein
MKEMRLSVLTLKVQSCGSWLSSGHCFFSCSMTAEDNAMVDVLVVAWLRCDVALGNEVFGKVDVV